MRRIVMPISGYAGVGKDTFAKAMREACPDYKIVKFADALKDMLAFILDVPREHMDNPVEKVKYRGALQRLGTDVFRKQVDPDWWVRALYDKMLKDPSTRVFLVPDARFPNELTFWNTASDVQCLPVRLDRKGIRPINAHASEIALNLYPYWFRAFHFPEDSLNTMHESAHQLALSLRELRESLGRL